MKKIKEGKTIDTNSKEYSAKSDILKEIKDVLSEGMAEKLKGMKKVTIASDTDEGLKAGLEKAEEVLDSRDEMEDEDSMDEDDMLEKLKKIAAEKAKKE